MPQVVMPKRFTAINWSCRRGDEASAMVSVLEFEVAPVRYRMLFFIRFDALFLRVAAT